MEQQSRLDLLKVMGTIFEDLSTLDVHWAVVPPLLAELTATSPQGLEGMASMISTHFINAEKFNDEKIKKFELESGLIKLKTYFQKLNAFEKVPS